MSTILKALKKLEERKASEGQRNGDIAWDILREQGRESEQLLPWRWWMIGVVTFLVIVLLIFWFTYRQLQPRDQRLTTMPSSSTSVRPAVPKEVPPQLPVKTSPPPVKASPPPVRPAEPTPSPGELSPIPADLKLLVSGIAFQESAEARMAIVNELPVMVGTVIDGVIVEQIEEQRVIFSRSNVRFAVPLSVSD